ncbi:hypothetical protein DS885_10280 [Psychromonas sp. B3M02]|uniref:AAA family ATPase n=1 Tax=Psychromonas sp. B3M02 TaxID=2267226 RepID=UPI000DE827BE|nr:AAA family ATPase [Psychromonas sp. B3M02]RBW45123.1 hypothetical protein DS885_10280 [Psychromonas sp. B3M02]
MVERTLIPLPSQLQLLDRLQHHIYLSSSLIMITGEAGSGKTTLTENLSNALPAELKQSYLCLSKVATVLALRQKVIEQLFEHALFNAQDKLVDSVERLQEESGEAQNRLLIIDNAHFLPTDFLIELSELLTSYELTENNNVNVILLGDTATTKRFSEYLASHLADRLRRSLNRLELILPALSTQEAKALLAHNFAQIDYQAKLQHQDALYHQLSLCAGNPHKIITLAETLSQGGFTEDKHTWVKTWLPAALLMLLLVVIVTALGIYLYPKFIPEKSEKIVELPIEQLIDPVSEPESSTNTEPLAGGWSTLDLDISDNESTVGLSDQKEQRVVVSDDQLITLPVLVEQPNNVMVEAPAVLKEQAIPALLTPNEAPSLSLDNQESVAQQIQQQATEGSEATQINAEQKEPEPAVEVVQQAPPNNEQKQATDSLFTASNILLSKNPKHLTIQLSAMSTRSYLSAFKQKYGAIENVFIYQTIRNNKPWFVVIYGEYTSQASANLAIKNLPAAFAGMPTWIKSWQAVHNDLRLNNE